MARRQTRTMIPRPAKKLDHTNWEYSTGSGAGIASGATSGQAFSTVGSRPATLLRIRGEVTGFLDTSQATGIGALITYGIILVPEGSGATVQFSPVSDGNAPWLLWGSGFVGYEEMVTDVIEISGLPMFRHVIDNKAMRIIRPDVEMQFVVENTTVFVASGINYAYSLRWLQGF